MTIPNDPAFPLIAENGLGHISSGLSKREYFAAMALPACIASVVKLAELGDASVMGKAPAMAVEYADMLIAELENEK